MPHQPFQDRQIQHMFLRQQRIIVKFNIKRQLQKGAFQQKRRYQFLWNRVAADDQRIIPVEGGSIQCQCIEHIDSGSRFLVYFAPVEQTDTAAGKETVAGRTWNQPETRRGFKQFAERFSRYRFPRMIGLKQPGIDVHVHGSHPFDGIVPAEAGLPFGNRLKPLQIARLVGFDVQKLPIQNLGITVKQPASAAFPLQSSADRSKVECRHGKACAPALRQRVAPGFRPD